LDLKEYNVLNGKCLTKSICAYDFDCIIVSYKLRAADTDGINIGLFSLEDGKLLYKFDET